MNNIGAKIRHFRKQKGISQLDLELMIETSPGSISRIENGFINPTKETIIKISEAIGLTMSETVYLLSYNKQDANKMAIDKVENLMRSPTYFGYLLDDEHKMIAISNGFRILMRVLRIDGDKLIGKTPYEILFDHDLGIRNILKEGQFEFIAKTLLARWHQERSHILEELWVKEMLERLRKYPDFERLWNLSKDPNIDIYSLDARKATFMVFGIELSFFYTYTPILSDLRYLLIEYRKL